MKYLVRVFLFNVFGLWLTSQLVPTLVLSSDWQTVLFAGAILSFLMLVVSPILKILFIPINLLTFGLLSWLINVMVIYLLTFLVPQVEIRSWTFPGLAWQGFIIPVVRLNYLAALIVSSLTVTFITNLLHYVSEQ